MDEVSIALNFITTYLYNKLPRRRVNFFGEELEKSIREKFEGHWHPEMPTKGSGYRCIRVSGEDIDGVMLRAANQSRLDIEEVREHLPRDLTVWIDPHEVSYRIGEKSDIKILYSQKSHVEQHDTVDTEIQSATGFNPNAQCFRPIDSLSSSMSSISLSPNSPTPSGGNTPTGLYGTQSSIPAANFLNRSKGPAFTTASFAATKFGSTKLKSQAKRPTHLGPNDLGGFAKQRGSGGLYSPQGVPPTLPSPQNNFLGLQRSASVSPREASHDRLDAMYSLMQHKQMQQQLQLQQKFQMRQQQQQLQPSPQHRLINMNQNQNMYHPLGQHGLSSPVGSGQSMADMLTCNTLGLDFMGSSVPSPASNNLSQNSYDSSLLGGSQPGSSLSSPDPSKALLELANSMPYSTIQQLIASN